MRYNEVLSTLQKLTKRTDIKQADLVKATGLSRSTMSNREAHNVEFSYKDIQKIEQYFDVKFAHPPCNEKSMRCNDLINKLEEMMGRKIETKEISKFVGFSSDYLNNMIKQNDYFDDADIENIERAYQIRLKDWGYKEAYSSTAQGDNSDNCIYMTYRPDVYLSAGYGVAICDELKTDCMCIDKRLLMSDRGTMINPKNCEIVRVSGNSMSPEYRHGDRVIIDLSDKQLADGHIFAFRYKGETYVKEVNLLGDKVKCLSLNKEYDSFYIGKDEDFEVFGRIVPRVRL